MTHDTELFELCKEVYERTRWDDMSLDYYLRLHKPLNQIFQVNRYEYDADYYRYRNSPATPRFKEENEVAILYTSDYLLDKLPKKIGPFDTDDYRGTLQLSPGSSEWFASYDYDKSSIVSADTLLKALLRLTLSLVEAGEIK